MAEKEQYLVRVGKRLVEVSPEVYYAYFQMRRQEQWQEEKKQEHKEVSYDALDDGDTLGIENVADVTAPTLDEIVFASEIREKVRMLLHCFPRQSGN